MKLYSDKVAPKPIIYLSGAHTVGTMKEETEFLKRTKCKFRCYSFGYSCPGAFYYSKRMHESLDLNVKKGIGVFMDSGAYSFQKFMHGEASKKYTPKQLKQLKHETIERYVKYCKEQGKNWDFYANFDYARDGQLVYNVQKKLEKEGIRPAPVYHALYSLSWLERYCKEGYKIIGVSGIARQQKSFRETQATCEKMHNLAARYGVKLHGFAVTAASLMFGYPWYSVDSTTWIRAAAMGMIIHPDLFTKTLVNIHVSTEPASHDPSYNKMQKHQRRQLERIVEDNGFDFKLVRESAVERRLYNATVFCQHLGPIEKVIHDSIARWESLV